MKLLFLGAAHEVTGSCHYLEIAGKKLLIDCGMQQGPDEYEYQELPVSAADIDYVLLTHAHIDHSGRIPLLAKFGFHGTIYTTRATTDLCGIMLRDSAHIQEFEAEWKNRKGKRAGASEIEPLYGMKDALAAIELLSPCDYNERIPICAGLEIRFTDVGHLLGSASIEVWAEEEGKPVKLVFSGDIGNLNQPLINNPAYTDSADYVVMESTYGDRLHKKETADYAQRLAGIIERTLQKGGNVVIPSFAVGRTQELLYFIREIKERQLVQGCGNFPVYVDSPLAIEATQIFQKNEAACYDFEAMELVRRGINPVSFPGLHMAVTSDESRNINFDASPKVIISASGMCEAGRIKHHLKHNLWRAESTIIFVGYQAIGTLGRSLAEGAKKVKVFGETIDVKAEVLRLEGMSGHADQAGLLEWLGAFETPPRHVFVVHGEDEVCTGFAQLIEEKLSFPASAPNYQEAWDLAENVCIKPGVKPTPRTTPAVPSPTAALPVSSVFGRLYSAGQRLMSLIERSRGGANKDLAKFADQVTAMCEKWEK